MDYEQNELFPGMTLEGRYTLIEQIGSGGMALVFSAKDNRLNRNVAVKIMRQELASNEKFRHRFQTESQAIAKLSHPNIVNVFDVSHSDSIEYIVMELIDGVTLKQYLRAKGRLGTRQMLNFSIQIAKALGHAHSKGVVHRDIKPQNILVVDDATVKVADFGIADLQSEVPDVENEAIGSVHYISPEQARGLPVDARSDLYSLGIVMYEMLSGIFGVLAFILILAVFLWNYWLRDIFTVNERITIPNFVGSNYETIINSKNFKSSFNFNLTYEIDPEVEKGVIIGQSPEAGKSYMLTEDGINVDLTISTGVMLIQIPETVGGDYREITSELEKLGFVVEKLYVSSNDVAMDSVIDISPAPGERLPAGATVYVTISLGPDEETVIMPYLVGDTQQNAEAQIEALRLTLVSVSAVYSKTVPAGCVVSQNVDAGTEIPVNSKIYLQISLGPEVTPTPEPTPTPSPEPAYQPEVVG
jgi:beta-lactam-binding protein with PASTA domain